MKNLEFYDKLKRLEREVAILVSETEPNTTERMAAVEILNKITEEIGKYIVNSCGGGCDV